MSSSAPTDVPSMYCRGCGYDVSRSTNSRCPECGLEFDPSDDSTYLVTFANPHKDLLLSLGAGIGCLCLWYDFGRTATQATGLTHFISLTCSLAALIGGLCMEFVTVHRAFKRHSSRYRDFRVRHGRRTLHWIIILGISLGIILPLLLLMKSCTESVLSLR